MEALASAPRGSNESSSLRELLDYCFDFLGHCNDGTNAIFKN